jgi:chromosome segregation ATPase
MKTDGKTFVLASLFVCLLPGVGLSQQTQQKSGTTDTSLGDIARQQKALKAKEAKPTKVFTNDNMPSAAGTGFEVNPKVDDVASADKGSGKHDEAYFRAQLSHLQGQLQTHQRELDVLQQKLGQNQTQYYSDPNKTLQQEYSRSDINKKTDEINAKKQQIADDQKAIDDLHDQLRHEGGDPAWLR